MSKRLACLFAVVPSVFAVICKHRCAGDCRRHGGGSEPGGDARAVACAGKLSGRAFALAVLVGATCVGARATVGAGAVAARVARGCNGKACGSVAGERVVLRRVALETVHAHPVRSCGKCFALGHCRARSAVRVVHKLELGRAGIGFELALE